MSDVLLCACFFVILFIPCVLATRSARRPDLAEDQMPEVEPIHRHVPLYQVSRSPLRPVLVSVSRRPQWAEAISGDFGELQDDYERQHQRLLELCSTRNQVA
jgi:hypothetical protein